ncbi:MAG TPA: hypothetical protein VLK84_09525, partial [Longimicrobium sp.]|nr:hypothetical protein [Longimicrobium sp.]
MIPRGGNPDQRTKATGMQPVPYLTRSSFFPAIESALDEAGEDFEQMSVFLGPRGYERDELIQVPGDEPGSFLTTWSGEPGRFSARIRAAASVLHRRGFRGRLRAVHEDGLLVLSRRWQKGERRAGCHDWQFAGYRITALTFDLSSVRMEAWAPEGSIRLRLGAQFSMQSAEQGRVILDPEIPLSCAPLLSLVGAELHRFTATGTGVLTMQAGGCTIEVAPHPEFEA